MPRGPGARTRKRRNRPKPSVLDCLERAALLLKHAAHADARCSVTDVVDAVERIEREFSHAVVTEEEAERFLKEYAAKYLDLGGGVTIPPHASVFFEGQFSNCFNSTSKMNLCLLSVRHTVLRSVTKKLNEKC